MKLLINYKLDDRGSIPGRGSCENFFSPVSRPALGSIQPPIQWVPVALTPGVKLPGRKTNHSPPSGAEVNAWSYEGVSKIFRTVRLEQEL
jgi:hypothetical protein